ncbi:hypothetical protein PILCRDRAFT_821273 [Piloderma croceum F 1598]|uniref:Pentacotripeptide-repeat region of PRORP domain-containing protein n=1 Tax=Piloderma croceum (strain F 1598) TaxID=765440 RepID=A0A0C3FQP9_PILCF|nr:hypothetical protein PILCRDRAFT_821273 [Piloderma croceum F 1598]
MSHILHALNSIRRLHPIHPSRTIYTAKSISKRQSLIRKSRSARLADEPLERRIEAGRINGLVKNVDRYVASGNRDFIQNYVSRKLSTEEFHNPSRSLAYDKIISSLLGHNLIRPALLFYERMIDERLIPSLFTRIQLEAMTIVHAAKTRKEVFSSLQKAFAEESFDEAKLGELITVLEEGVKTRYPAHIIDRIVKLFIISQGPGYKPSAALVCRLVDLLVRNRSTKCAKHWLDLAKELSDLEAGPSSPSPSPYVTFLEALSKIEPTDIPAQLAVMNKMKHNKVIPNVSVYNTLIATQIRLGNLESACNLYSTLLQLRPDSEQPSPKPTIIPNAPTFIHMFGVVKRIKVPRGVRSRQYKRPKNAPSARKLYGDMVESHLIETRGRPTQPSSVVTPSSFHLALRTFMIMSDYTAAFVAIRSLGMYGMPTNLDTYQIVIKGLLRRMHHELGSARGVDERRWVDVLLGREEGSQHPPGMTADMVVQLMQFGLDSRITLDDLPEIEDIDDVDEQISHIPSLSLIMGQETPTEGVAYSATPLQRILRRALLAQVTLSFKSEIAGSPPAVLFSKIVAHAKQTMVRDLPSWVETPKPTKGRRSHGSAHSAR